ncbi:hypothetical protein GO986_12190 [Deinococcus sp. HMF7620]|uniref:Uncharacterized protein n=1 Tax=Deinococcus arboris TaxID=2682977 RepID=A0A7C9M6Z1_9DEIO|nr:MULTISPECIES: hypothetical protein [Deinococcus]MBZ9752123.1 hypothetical protein [Deinococcus betulae]MVN87525.1 hypothetical protein [Deinococcus arboris]
MQPSVLRHDHLDADVLSRLRHVNARLTDYHGLRLTGAEYMRLCRLITQRRIPYQVLRRDHQNRQILRLRWRGVTLLLVYSPARGLLHTALHPLRGLSPKRRPTGPQARQVGRGHAFARRDRAGRQRHADANIALIQVARPAGAQGTWRSK